MTSSPISLRARLAVVIMHYVARVSRSSGRGGGSIIGGRVALAIDPHLIRTLSKHRQIVMVSGTNGKTTTTRLIVEALGGIDGVATSPLGSNMPAGIVTALGHRDRSAPAVLEVDEGYLPRLIDDLETRVVVLLNLSRDQLDRVGEVRMIASRWQAALTTTDAIVVANADDPLVVFAAQRARNVRWVGTGTGTSWRDDSYHCPNCEGRITYELGGWSCSCGSCRPALSAEISGEQLIFDDGSTFALTCALPGTFNRANLALATVAVRELGIEPASAISAMSTVTEIAGRFASVAIANKRARLLLAKNPAGWSSLIDLVKEESTPLLIAINARIADGHDPSWLFDVPFEHLIGRTIVTSGDRRYDLGVRLRHAGVRHIIGDTNPYRALRSISAKSIDVIANYTAFQDLRRDVAHVHDHPHEIDNTITLAQVGGLATHSTPRPVGARRDPLSIIVIYPDLLGTYGDSGNGIVLANRARWRGFDVELVYANSDEALPLSGDIYLIGGGEDGPQVHASEQLRQAKLERAVTNGAVVFGVCAGYQLLGTSFPDASGNLHEGACLLDVTTVRTPSPRAVGELLGRPTNDTWPVPLGQLTGFENHASHCVLGDAASPLMQVQFGVGNGNNGTDGAFAAKVFGTYLHGPVLARNPQLADLLLSLASGVIPARLDDHEEQLLRHERIHALGRRRTNAR